MRVVHLSTTYGLGGAGIAVMRLHEALLGLGIDSRVVTRKSARPLPTVSEVDSPLFEVADHFEINVLNAAKPPCDTIVSAMPVEVDIHSHPWIQEAEIVHLHWVASFIDASCVPTLKRAGKTLFWSFHDQRPYTGGCHFTAGCKQYEDSCDVCPQLPNHLQSVAKLNRSALHSFFEEDNLQAICGSQQAVDLALNSGLFNRQQLHLIPYGIDKELYAPAARISDSTGDKIQFLFGCHSVEEKRKGFDHLKAALCHCASNPVFNEMVNAEKLELVTFGNDSDALYKDIPCPVRRLGAISQAAVAQAFQKASVYLCPTLEDAGPQVVVESLACACPVIAYPTGLVSDIVRHEVNGLIVKSKDSMCFAQAIQRYISDSSLRHHLREGALTEQDVPSLLDSARATLNLYQTHLPRVSQQFCENCALPNGNRYALQATIKPAYAQYVVSFLAQSFEQLRSKLKSEIKKKETLKHKLKEARDKLEKQKATFSQKKSGSMLGRLLAKIRTLTRMTLY